MAPPQGSRGSPKRPDRRPARTKQKKRFELTFVCRFCMSERCTEPLSQKSGFKDTATAGQAESRPCSLPKNGSTAGPRVTGTEDMAGPSRATPAWSTGPPVKSGKIESEAR